MNRREPGKVSRVTTSTAAPRERPTHGMSDERATGGTAHASLRGDMIRPLLLAPALAALACGGVQVERYAEGEPVPTDMDLGFSEPAAPEHPENSSPEAST